MAESTSRPLRLREIVEMALLPRDSPWPDVLPDYEAYHASVETGNVLRAARLADWIEPESTVLDVGCGDGRVAAYVRRTRGATVLGIEVSEAAARKALAQGLEVRLQDLDADPTLPEGYDHVMLVEVLEHLSRPHRVLREAARVARRSVLVTIPNSGFLPYRVQALRGMMPRQSFTHLHLWSHTDFLALCRQLGLSVDAWDVLTSARTVRRNLLRFFPNLFAAQLFYRIAPARTTVS